MHKLVFSLRAFGLSFAAVLVIGLVAVALTPLQLEELLAPRALAFQVGAAFVAAAALYALYAWLEADARRPKAFGVAAQEQRRTSDRASKKLSPEEATEELVRHCEDAFDHVDEEEVKELLRQGADVNARLSDTGVQTIRRDKNWRPLLGVVSRGCGSRSATLRVLKLFLDAGAEVRFRCDTTPLHLAVENWEVTGPEVVEALLAAGAAVDIKDREGKTALHYAKGVRCVQILLAAGVDVNARSHNAETALHVMTQNSSAPAALKTVIDAGANVNAKDKDGTTALHEAVGHYGEEEKAKLLVAAGADVNAIGEGGRTPLHCAVEFAREGNESSFVEILLAASADVNIPDRSGQLAIDRAARLRREAVIAQLRQAGCDADVDMPPPPPRSSYSQIHCSPNYQPAPYSNAEEWARGFFEKAVRAAEAGKFLNEGDWQISHCTTRAVRENPYVHIFASSTDGYDEIRALLDGAGVPSEQEIEHAHWIPEPLTLSNLERNLQEANVIVHAYIQSKDGQLRRSNLAQFV